MRCLSLIILLAVAVPGRGQDPKAVVERAIKAHGGAESLAKTKNLTQSAKGRVNRGGVDVDATREATLSLPDRAIWSFEFSMSGAKTAFRIAVTGPRGWQTKDGLPATDLGSSEYDTMVEANHMHWLCNILPLTSKELTLKALKDDVVGKEPVHVISVSKAERSDVQLSFSKETGLLVKTVYVVKEVGKPTKYEAVLEDHKLFAGVRFPTKITDFRDNVRVMNWTVTNITFVERFDDKTFRKP